MGGFKPLITRYEATVSDFFVNAFLVETEHGVVAIDATLAISSSRALRSLIDDKIKKPLLAVLLTHGHPDHFTGLGELTKGLDVPILATQGSIDFAKAEDKEKEPIAMHIFGEEFPKKRMFPNKVVKGGETHTFDGVSFSLTDYGPGESDDDTAWTLDIDGVKHVFLGDMIHNQMHCFFRDGHAINWIKNLDRLLVEYDHTAVLYTSHGNPCGIEIVYWHRAYMQAFIGILKSMLRGKDALNDAEKDALVGKMKSFLPNDKTLFLLTYEMDTTIALLRKNGVV